MRNVYNLSIRAWLLSLLCLLVGEGTEKVPFFYDQNGKCLRFVTSLSANRLNKAKIDR